MNRKDIMYILMLRVFMRGEGGCNISILRPHFSSVKCRYLNIFQKHILFEQCRNSYITFGIKQFHITALLNKEMKKIMTKANVLFQMRTDSKAFFSINIYLYFLFLEKWNRYEKALLVNICFIRNKTYYVSIEHISDKFLLIPEVGNIILLYLVFQETFRKKCIVQIKFVLIFCYVFVFYLIYYI